MSLTAKLLSASGGAGKLYVDDVFSTYTYTGNSSTQTINNGIDLAGKGGMVWIKNRTTGARDHILTYTTRGATKTIYSNATLAEQTISTALTAFTSSGFSVGSSSDVNQSVNNIVSWTFRNADKFYNHAVVTKSSGSNATVSFANLGTLGIVRVKRTDSTGSWYIWHRSLSAGQLLIGETTAAAATLGHVTVSGTTVTLVNGVIADGTYLVEAFAHDPSADGFIQCGSYTGNGSATGPIVNLGWEPQYLMIKRASGTGNWQIIDSMRGMPVGSADAALQTNATTIETSVEYISPTATGFQITSANVEVNLSGNNYTYLAIRRPNKPPTTGTQVYNAIARTGSSAATSVTGVGFSPDLILHADRQKVAWAQAYTAYDKLRGVAKYSNTQSTAAEGDLTPFVTSVDVDGVTLTNSGFNSNATTYISHFFKRAPGVFDVVCYTGTGVARTVPHNLGVAPELMIVKVRSVGGTGYGWLVFNNASGATKYLNLQSVLNATVNSQIWNGTTPTNIDFTVGTNQGVNGSGYTYVAYLFTSLPGISKVGSYTGNGASQIINCGFTTGARFILIKRTELTGAWYVWDTARGVVAGNDPHLSLNTTAAEVTTNDSVDPDASGFIVNQVDATNINVSGGSYIFLAIA